MVVILLSYYPFKITDFLLCEAMNAPNPEGLIFLKKLSETV